MIKRRKIKRKAKGVQAILTTAKGVPITKPLRSEFKTDVDYVRAFHSYKDRIISAANSAFDAEFQKRISK